MTDSPPVAPRTDYLAIPYDCVKCGHHVVLTRERLRDERTQQVLHTLARQYHGMEGLRPSDGTDHSAGSWNYCASRWCQSVQAAGTIATSPSPRPDPQTIARLDRGTAEDRHRAALMHPRRLGAPGCICDLDVADSGTAQPLDVERLALDDPIVKALRYPCKEPMHKEAARALEARLAASGDERHEADWSDEKRKEQLRLRNAEEDRL